jgi:hypothetical protein
MWRFFRFLKFWESAARRAELREELRTEASTQRALLESRRDVLLERDLAESEKDEKSRRTQKR